MKSMIFRRPFAEIILLAVIALVWFFGVAPAFAQDTTVTIPVGAWYVSAIPVLSFIAVIVLVLALTYAKRLLPPWAQAVLDGIVMKQLVAYAAQAINAGFMATAGAVKDKEITLNVGNPLVAKAAQEAVNKWPKWAVDKLGGITGVKAFIVSQLEDRGIVLPPEATTEQILSSVDVRSVTGPR